jgi:putative toxin-antitoxin system antitoxin component (TIGR02293 family)
MPAMPHVAHDIAADAEIRGGYPVAVATSLQQRLRLTDAQLADVLGCSRRTYVRYRERETRLSVSESERVFRYLYLLRRGDAVFGSEVKAAAWLMEPNAALDGRTPFDVALTTPGATLVEDRLGGIEHGFPV